METWAQGDPSVGAQEGESTSNAASGAAPAAQEAAALESSSFNTVVTVHVPALETSSFNGVVIERTIGCYQQICREPPDGCISINNSLPLSQAESRPAGAVCTTVPLQSISVVGHPMPAARRYEVVGYPASRQALPTPERHTGQQRQSYWQQRQYRLMDALVVSVMCILMVIFAFCVLAMVLAQRQWTHTADSCWFDGQTLRSRFFPSVNMHPHNCQLTIGWLGYSYCNDTDSLFQECKNRFANFHLSIALQIVGVLAILALCLTAVWALAIALTFLKLLGKDPEDAVKLHAKYSRFYHPFHGFNWLLPVVTILLCVPGFEIAAWAAIHEKDSTCTYTSLVFDPGQIFCVTAVSLILVVIPVQHWLLTRLTGRLPMQMQSQITTTVP